MVKYLAWCPRPTNDLTAVDVAVRESAGLEIGEQYPVQGWASGSADLGGAVSVSFERFPGAISVWIWEA